MNFRPLVPRPSPGGVRGPSSRGLVPGPRCGRDGGGRGDGPTSIIPTPTYSDSYSYSHSGGRRSSTPPSSFFSFETNKTKQCQKGVVSQLNNKLCDCGMGQGG